MIPYDFKLRITVILRHGYLKRRLSRRITSFLHNYTRLFKCKNELDLDGDLGIPKLKPPGYLKCNENETVFSFSCAWLTFNHDAAREGW